LERNVSESLGAFVFDIVSKAMFDGR